MTVGIGLERVVAHGQMPEPGEPEPANVVVEVENVSEQGVSVRVHPPDDQPVRPLTAYGQKVLRSQRTGTVYPYELLRLLTLPPGTVPTSPRADFVEHDLDEQDRLVPVERPYGQNSAHVVVGVLTNSPRRSPKAWHGSSSWAIPPRASARWQSPNAGASAQPSTWPSRCRCRSSGSRSRPAPASRWTVARRTWTGSRPRLRRIIEFTQAGGEVNVVVAGINVGAQPYWNAEATMLMHTRGILVMTPTSAMVLTGKQALDFAGGVSAEDNYGIGGYDRVMGPNGQAQYWAPTLSAACQVLLRHYEHTYIVPGRAAPAPGANRRPDRS